MTERVVETEPETGIFLTEGGSFVRLDLPREGTIARERHDEKVKNGELVEIDEGTVHDVTRPDGSIHIELKDPPESGEVKRARLGMSKAEQKAAAKADKAEAAELAELEAQIAAEEAAAAEEAGATE